MENVINHALNQYTQLYSNIMLWAKVGQSMTPPVSPDQPISPATLNQSISLLSLSTSALCRSCGTYGHLATADVVKLWNLKRKIYRHTERRKWNSRFNHWMWNVSEVVTEINSRKRNPLSTCAHATRNIKISKFPFCSNFIKIEILLSKFDGG